MLKTNNFNKLFDSRRTVFLASLLYHFFVPFVKHSEKSQWLYKNGDKGIEYFSLVYRMAFGRANFYPDYIIELTNGDEQNGQDGKEI